jgi:lipopolysaccharide export system permease protein
MAPKSTNNSFNFALFKDRNILRKIYTLILKSYLGPLVFTFFIALFILLMQFLWMYIDDLVGKGLEWYIIAELLFYASSTFVPLALPLAILLSSIMTFGNLGEHYELVAMKAAGISLRKIMKPLVILSFIISGIAFFFSNNVLPVANLKFKSLLYDVRKQKLAFDIKEGIFYNDMEGFVMRVGSKDDDDKTIHDVMIYNHTDKRGNIDLTVAKYGWMESTQEGRYLILTLFDGYNYRESIDQKNYYDTKPFQRTHFAKEIRRFDLSAFELSRTNEELFKKNYQMLNIRQLNTAIDSLNEIYFKRKNVVARDFAKQYFFYSRMDSTAFVKSMESDTGKLEILAGFNSKQTDKIMQRALEQARNLKRIVDNYDNDYLSREEHITKHKIAWHKKFTLSFACLLLFFIGAPLGAIIRKGGFGLPVVISVFFFIIYHILSITGEKAAKAGALDVYFGMWLSSIALLPLGIFLTYKATTDSPLLDTESWKKRFQKLFKKKSNNY